MFFVTYSHILRRDTLHEVVYTRALSVLREPLRWLEGIQSARRPERLPVMLKREEVESILTHPSGTVGWMIRLLYGTGMRIMGCIRLRGKDVDFARTEIVFR